MLEVARSQRTPGVLGLRRFILAGARRISCTLQRSVSRSVGADSDQEGEHDSGTAAGSEEDALPIRSLVCTCSASLLID